MYCTPLVGPRGMGKDESKSKLDTENHPIRIFHLLPDCHRQHIQLYGKRGRQEETAGR